MDLRERMLKAIEPSAGGKLPVNGKDIMRYLGIGAGPWIGKLLALVQDAWDDNPNLTKEEALTIVKIGHKELNK